MAVFAPADAGFLADQLVRRLEEARLSGGARAFEEQFGRYRRRLRSWQAKFTDSVLAGRQAVVRLESGAGGLDASDHPRQPGRFHRLADLIALSRRGGALTGMSASSGWSSPNHAT